MKRTNRLVLLIGVFLAALAFVLVIVLLSGPGTTNPNASQPPSKVATVVAARDIALGVTITADMVKTQQLDPEARNPGAFADTSQVVGNVARASVKSGQQITALTFTEQSGAGLEVPAGFTAIAVQVDQVSGVGTLIKTGDFVDIVAGVSTGDQKFPVLLPGDPVCVGNPVPKLDDTCYDHTSVKVLVQGVQVLTTLLPPPPTTETGAASPAPDNGGTALNGQQEIVILAVTTQQVEVIKFAQLDGNISLVLRSPKDFVDASGNPIVPETVPTTGIILKTLVDKWGVLAPQYIYTIQPNPSAKP